MFFRRKKNTNRGDAFLLREDSAFLMQEDYKALRTNIAFSFPDSGSKVLAVTSATRSEGKSTNAINLAISCANLGKKVLLIDCDLRLPTVETKLGINKSQRKGLSDLLVSDLDPDAVAEVVDEFGITVICAGTLPPDPTRLLQSDKMSRLLEKMKESYDYIILDCPPINAVIDAVLLASNVDGYVVVVRHGESDHRDIRIMLQQMQRANCSILGFVYANAPHSNNRHLRRYGRDYYKYYYAHK